MPRGASRDAGARVMCARDPAIRVRPSNRAVRRNPDNAPSRRATPLIARGRKETGSPAPDPKSGTSIALAVHSDTQERCAREDAIPPRSSPRKWGPSLSAGKRGSGSPPPRGRTVRERNHDARLPAPRGRAQHRGRFRSRGPTKGPSLMRAISLAEANKIITGTFASAKRRKAYALAAIVLDAGGRVKAFQKQDGASLLRFEIAYGKAFAA